MEIKKKNGKLMTATELYDYAVEKLVEELDSLATYKQIELGNDYRDSLGYDRLYENNEENLNEQLDGIDPYQLLCIGNDEWSGYEDYFVWNGYDLEMTDDVWADIDEEELARNLIDRDFVPEDYPYEIAEVIDEYHEALYELENYNQYRAMCEEVVQKYTNCQADVTDLLQTLDKLARTDEAWERDN